MKSSLPFVHITHARTATPQSIWLDQKYATSSVTLTYSCISTLLIFDILFFSPYHHPPHQVLGQGGKSYIKLSAMLLGRAGNIHWNMMSFLPIVDVTRIIEFWRDLVGMRYSMCNFTTFSLPVVQVPSSRSFLTTHRLLYVIISISFSLRPRSLLLFGKMYFFLLRVHVPIFVTS